MQPLACGTRCLRFLVFCSNPVKAHALRGAAVSATSERRQGHRDSQGRAWRPPFHLHWVDGMQNHCLVGGLVASGPLWALLFWWAEPSEGPRGHWQQRWGAVCWVSASSHLQPLCLTRGCGPGTVK